MMFLLNIPSLIVIIPMIFAGLCAFTSSGRVAWAFAFIGTILSSLCVIIAAGIFARSGVIEYVFGGFEAFESIEYKLDILSLTFLGLISFSGVITLLATAKTNNFEIASNKRALFYSVFLLCFSGLLGIIITNDIFNIYVFLEISSLATYTLIAQGKRRRALRSAFDYLVLGTIGATLILIGVGLIYISTGTLNIDEVVARLDSVDGVIKTTAWVFILMGIALKLAIFPLHGWLVNSYHFAPVFVSSFLSGTATKVMVYLLLRFAFSVFGVEFAFTQHIVILLVILSAAGAFIGSLSAIFERSAKRILALSSVAQISYIILMVAIASSASISAGITHSINHAMAKILLFTSLSAIIYKRGGANLMNFKGVAKQMPITFIGLLVGGLSLVGIPSTAGFVSKFMMLSAMIEQGNITLVLVLMTTSLLALIYIYRLLTSCMGGFATLDEAPISALVAIGVLIWANIYFGINPDAITSLATQISDYLGAK